MSQPPLILRPTCWLRLTLQLLALAMIAPRAGAQCPWARDSAELHSDCICDFSPSSSSAFAESGQSQPVNRMSVQCSPVQFHQLMQALKQTASVELPKELLIELLQPATTISNSALPINNSTTLPDYTSTKPETDLLKRELASQAKLDLLHVSNCSLPHLQANAFLADLRTGNQSRNLVVAMQALHLNRCFLERIQPGAFNGLEWSLVALSLSDNLLQWLPMEPLRRLSQLRVLDLSNNRLTKLPADGFFSLQKLSTLRLTDNRFSGASPLDPAAFRGLERSLTDLNLKGAQLDQLPVEALRGLRQLNFLNLAQNHIEWLPPRSFRTLTTLTAINLERNRLVSLEPETFVGLEESLSSLSLLANLLSFLPQVELARLSHLRRLDLGFNQISHVPERAFSNNTQLLLVALDGNPLESLSELAFQGLRATLRGISVGGRTLSCDCRLAWLLAWNHFHGLQISSRERQPQFCASPAHLRPLASFASLKPEQLVCDPTGLAGGLASTVEEPKAKSRFPAPEISTGRNEETSSTIPSEPFASIADLAEAGTSMEPATTQVETESANQTAELARPMEEPVTEPVPFPLPATRASSESNRTVPSVPSTSQEPAKKLNRQGYLAGALDGARWTTAPSGAPHLLHTSPQPSANPRRISRPMPGVFGSRAGFGSQGASALNPSTLFKGPRLVDELEIQPHLSQRWPQYQQPRDQSQSQLRQHQLQPQFRRQQPTEQSTINGYVTEPIFLELARFNAAGAALSHSMASSSTPWTPSAVGPNNTRMSVSSMYRLAGASNSRLAASNFVNNFSNFSNPASTRFRGSSSAAGTEVSGLIPPRTRTSLTAIAEVEPTTRAVELTRNADVLVSRGAAPIPVLVQAPANVTTSSPVTTINYAKATSSISPAGSSSPTPVQTTLSPSTIHYNFTNPPASSTTTPTTTTTTTSTTTTTTTTSTTTAAPPIAISSSTTVSPVTGTVQPISNSAPAATAAPAPTSSNSVGTNITASTINIPESKLSETAHSKQTLAASGQRRPIETTVRPQQSKLPAEVRWVSQVEPPSLRHQPDVAAGRTVQVVAPPVAVKASTLGAQVQTSKTSLSSLSGQQGQLWRAASMDQLALALASLLCGFMLLLALSLACLCYASCLGGPRRREPAGSLVAASGARLASLSSLSSQRPVVASARWQRSRWFSWLQLWAQRPSRGPTRKHSGSSQTGSDRIAWCMPGGTSDEEPSSSAANSQQALSPKALDRALNECQSFLLMAHHHQQQQQQANKLAPLSFAGHKQSSSCSRLTGQPRAKSASQTAAVRGRRAEQLSNQLHQQQQQLDACNSSSCDSDKSCSPGAQRNNRYNLAEAHRAHLRGARVEPSLFMSSTCAQAQPAAPASLLLRTCEPATGTREQLATMAELPLMEAPQSPPTDYYRRSALADCWSRQSSSDAHSSTDDSRAPLRWPAQSRAFVLPGRPELEHSEPSQQLQPLPFQQRQCWPEPYLDPADQQQQQQQQQHQQHQQQQYPERTGESHASISNGSVQAGHVNTRSQLQFATLNQTSKQQPNGAQSFAHRRSISGTRWPLKLPDQSSWNTASRSRRLSTNASQHLQVHQHQSADISEPVGPLLRYRSIPSLAGHQSAVSSGQQSSGGAGWLRWNANSGQQQQDSWQPENQLDTMYIAAAASTNQMAR